MITAVSGCGQTEEVAGTTADMPQAVATTAEAAGTTEAVATVAATTEAPKPAINLPLVIKNNTVTEKYYIDTDGNIKEFGSDEVLMSDVRSIHYFDGTNEDNTYFFIKNDNTLWGFGKNYHGFLGETMDIDDIKDAVKIPIENVANVYTVEHDYLNTSIYVITTNKELYGWGEEDSNALATGFLGDSSGLPVISYKPIKILNNAIMFSGRHGALSADGNLYTWDENYSGVISNNYKPTIVMNSVKFAFADRWNNEVITLDNTYFKFSISFFEDDISFTSTFYDNSLKLDSFVQVDPLLDGSYYFITSDGALYGENPYAREFELKKISDSVICLYELYYVDSDNKLYLIKEDNSGVDLIMEDVAYVSNSRRYQAIYILKTDGTIVDEKGEIIAENVMLPSEEVIN
jgi:hypothetical protein